MTSKPNHKVEIIEAGKKKFAELAEVPARIFRCEPERLKIVRADLTADVPDVPVPWFHDHAYVAYKRVRRMIGEIPGAPFMAVRNAKAQTLYYGKDPNAYRIYDKIGEEMDRYAAMQRSYQKADLRFIAHDFIAWHERVCPEEPVERAMVVYKTLIDDPKLHILGRPHLESFETIFAPHRVTDVLTRVERQCHGRDLDKLELTNLESFRNARYLRPFDRVRFFAKDVELKRTDWSYRDWAIGQQIKRDVENYGLDDAREILKAHCKSNLPRWWNKYQPFILAASMEKIVGITSAELQVEYERSTYLQMAA